MATPLSANKIDYKINETKPFNKDFVKYIWSELGNNDKWFNEYNTKYKSAYDPIYKASNTVEEIINSVDNSSIEAQKGFDMDYAYVYWRQHIKGYIIGFPKMSKKIFDDMKWDAYKKLCTAKMKKGDMFKASITYIFTYERQQKFHNHLKKYNIYSDDICDYPDWR